MFDCYLLLLLLLLLRGLGSSLHLLRRELGSLTCLRMTLPEQGTSIYSMIRTACVSHVNRPILITPHQKNPNKRTNNNKSINNSKNKKQPQKTAGIEVEDIQVLTNWLVASFDVEVADLESRVHFEFNLNLDNFPETSSWNA